MVLSEEYEVFPPRCARGMKQRATNLTVEVAENLEGSLQTFWTKQQKMSVVVGSIQVNLVLRSSQPQRRQFDGRNRTRTI